MTKATEHETTNLPKSHRYSGSGTSRNLSNGWWGVTAQAPS